MAVAITIPKLGLTMTDCTLVEWRRSDGDKVAAGDVLFTVETDKIANEIEAERDGYLQRAAAVDSVHEVGACVGFLHETRDAALTGAAAHETAAAPAETGDPDIFGPIPAQSAPSLRVDLGAGRVLISPVARRIAAQNGLPLDALARCGTGPGGSILKRDVERRLREDAAAPVAAEANGGQTTRPLRGMRRTIANRMMQSLQGSAQMTAFARIDMGGTVALRQALAAQEAEFGVRITYTDIMVKAVATVLQRMPKLNSAIVGDEIIEWDDVNIGIAVALEDGLVVPVVHRTQTKTLVEIAHARKALIAKARSGALTAGDLAGGTFSISNFGSYGGDFETPILNPPQSAILGFGAVTDEPAVRDGAIVIRPMMMLSMTFDHRLIDGADAGAFRARLRAFLETPELQLAVMR